MLCKQANSNIISIGSETYSSGRLFPDFGMDERRSNSWKTLLLAPAAFMTTVYKLDNPDTDDPTANGKADQEMHGSALKDLVI